MFNDRWTLPLLHPCKAYDVISLTSIVCFKKLKNTLLEFYMFHKDVLDLIYSIQISSLWKY